MKVFLKCSVWACSCLDSAASGYTIRVSIQISEIRYFGSSVILWSTEVVSADHSEKV